MKEGVFSMRRKELEVKDINEILDIMSKCDVCRIALHDDEYPYVLPLNFGFETVDSIIYIYFHGALEGKKYDLMRKNNKAGFEMDYVHNVVIREKTGFATTEFESVMGNGVIDFIEGEQKLRALKILVKQYYKDDDFKIDISDVPRTCVFRLTVNEISGKRKILKK